MSPDAVKRLTTDVQRLAVPVLSHRVQVKRGGGDLESTRKAIERVLAARLDQEPVAEQAPAKPAVSAAKPGAPTSGAAVFERCVSCHSLTPDKHGIGPSLAGVAGRKAGSSSGFAYSAAMKNSAVVWGRETLDRHLRDVKGFIPGNNMAYMFAAGVQQEQERAALIEYLLSK